MKDAFFFQNVEAPRTSDFGLKGNQWLKKGGWFERPKQKKMKQVVVFF
jgi:hypothetical protein